MAVIYATRSPEISEREKRNMERSRRIAAQGMVLLKNDGVLPLPADGRKLAVFGSGVRRTVKGGTGSGDVNSRSVYTVEQGLVDAGFTIGSASWLDRFDEACSSAMGVYMEKISALIREKGPAGFMEVMENPYRDPDVPEITMEDLTGADRSCAVYVISRNSGEGADRKAVPGDYELTEREIQNLEALTAGFEHTVVVLNVGGVIDTSCLRGMDGISAILLMSQAGNISGLALADVLTGKVNPSGHLTATWAERFGDYPSAETFSYRNGDVDDEYYLEGIYVGYRYFDSFGVTPAYPFGFGGSYTEFAVTVKSVELQGGDVTVSALVKNTGAKYAGREVVQAYVSQPEGSLDKPYQVLAGYAKTDELAPGAEQCLTITFPVSSLASYDEEKAAYLLEKGEYVVRVGTHSRNTHIAAVLTLDETIITEQLKNNLVPDCDLSVLKADRSAFFTYDGEAAEKEKAPVIAVPASAVSLFTAVYSGTPEALVTDKTEKVTMQDVLAGTATLDDLTAQLTVPELADLCVGTARGGFGSQSTIGAASTACPGAAGDTTSALLESRGVVNLVLADGPAGLRLSPSFVADKDNNIIPGLGQSAFGNMDQLLGIAKPERPSDAVDYYQYCTAIPIATLLAQTWDLAAIEEAGDIAGEEMEEFGVTLWLAPGMNIHRNPLCGRNFEYYSEDPLVAGLCAAADTLGVQKHPGCGTTIKHFALNNQEDNRTHSNAHCTERAIREIYLKGFEIAVKRSAPLSLMTSYNLINGQHSANRYELLTSILRDEWGFGGVVMTDWGTTGGGGFDAPKEYKYGNSDTAGCIKAGNDLTMPGSQQDVDTIIAAVGADPAENPFALTLGELQACAKRVLALAEKRERAVRR